MEIYLPQDNMWMDEGLCRTYDQAIFFPEPRQSSREAKRICRRCPVSEACLVYALDNGEQHGIWGGTSPRERRLMRRNSKNIAPSDMGAAQIAEAPVSVQADLPLVTVTPVQ